MADINPLDPNAAQLMDLSQQRKLADLLTQQGLQSPQGQMVSGQYVKSSPLQYFANMANLYAGQKTGEQATQKATDYANALRQQGGVEVQDILETYKTDPNAALKKAAMAVSPEAKSLATQLSKVAITEKPTSVQEYQYGQQDPRFAEYQMGLKRAGGTNLNVNTGQHGFDNALKLRSDFRAEPIYKGFEETKAAKLQIDQASKMASPAGDLAAATKIMKILDPGSVVRESELGMAMAATGVEDKVRNYAKMVIDGTKLTPSQRKDFTELSSKLYNASAEQFNQKRNEYAGIAERNKLDVNAAVGSPAEIKVTQGGWRIK